MNAKMFELLAYGVYVYGGAVNTKAKPNHSMNVQRLNGTGNTTLSLHSGIYCFANFSAISFSSVIRAIKQIPHQINFRSVCSKVY